MIALSFWPRADTVWVLSYCIHQHVESRPDRSKRKGIGKRRAQNVSTQLSIATTKPIIALLMLLFLTACAPEPSEQIGLCLAGRQAGKCTMVNLDSVHLDGTEVRLERTVVIARSVSSPSRIFMVRIVALASAEVSWNGVVIGRNGIPSADPAHETVGRFIAGYVIPAELLRDGRNMLTVRMSAHQLFLPVRSPIQVIEVVPYEMQALPGLSGYLLALLAFGALVAGLICFAVSAWNDHRDRYSHILALIAGLAMLQLGTEVARILVDYSYPWQLARVAVVALLSAAISTLIVAFSALRFAPEQRRSIVASTAFAAVANLVFMPWSDLKALGAILTGMLALGYCVLVG
jgi:hypothetical protein